MTDTEQKAGTVVESATATPDVWLSWWTQYIDQNSRNTRNWDPAVRARLRRCHTWSDAMSIAEAHELARRVGVSPTTSPQSVVHVFNTARVLAHVKVHRRETMMERAGAPPDGKRLSDDSMPLVSAVRYRRLLAAEPGDDLTAMVVRVLAQLKGECNASRLAKDLMMWTERTRVAWSFQYFGKTAGQRTDPITFAPSPSDSE